MVDMEIEYATQRKDDGCFHTDIVDIELARPTIINLYYIRAYGETHPTQCSGFKSPWFLEIMPIHR